MPGQKNNIVFVLLVIAAWCMALAMAYLVICKIRLLLQ